MSPIRALIYGIVQGFTEFLPVSSSGHLVLASHLLGIEAPGITLEVMVHFGTLLAVLAIYWKDIKGLAITALALVIPGFNKKALTVERKSLLLLIIVGTIPAAVLGLLFKPYFERAFTSTLMVGLMLLVTGSVLMLASKQRAGKKKAEKISVIDAVYIGLAQAAAMLPGISRSGMTISAGLGRKMERQDSARFSFLLATPAILGATILEMRDMGAVFESGALEPIPLFIAVLASFVSGYIAIKVLLKVLQTGRLELFAYYCWMIGGGAIILNIANIL